MCLCVIKTHVSYVEIQIVDFSLISFPFSDIRYAMTLLLSTVLLTFCVTQTLPKDSVLYDGQRAASVTWVLQGSEVSLRCQVNTSRCGQYHNVKGRFRN